MYDAAGTPLYVGDAVAFMNLVNGGGYVANTMGIGHVTGFPPQMVRIQTTIGNNIVRMPDKIAKVYIPS